MSAETTEWAVWHTTEDGHYTQEADDSAAAVRLAAACSERGCHVVWRPRLPWNHLRSER